MIIYLQSNISKKDKKALQDIATRLNIQVLEFYHIPFSTSHPSLNLEQPIFVYAASTVTDEIISTYNSFAGVFAHSSEINMKNLFIADSAHMWSNLVAIEPLSKIKDINLENKTYFLRPAIDDKWFAGTTMSTQDIHQWLAQLETIEVDMHQEIIIGEVNYPQQEYRLFIVDGNISTSSLYRQEMNLCVEPSAPARVHEFALEFIEKNKHLLPNSFVLDIATSTEKIGVIEVNSINNSGFYAADKALLIKDLKKVCEKLHKNKIAKNHI